MRNILQFAQNFSRSGISCSLFLFAFLAVPALQSQTYTLLHSFKFSDGTFPANGLTVDSQGNLYGVASSGGDSNCQTARAAERYLRSILPVSLRYCTPLPRTRTAPCR